MHVDAALWDAFLKIYQLVSTLMSNFGKFVEETENAVFP